MTVFRILVYFLCLGLWRGIHSHLYYNGSSGQNPDCQVTDKVDCLEGELEDKIGQERCDFLGCCWEEQPGSPYCFYQGGSCQGNQCVRGQGICKPEESGYTCDCHYPYYGEFCQYSDYNRVCPSNRDQCHNFDVVDFQCDGLGCCWQDNFCFHSDDQPLGPDGFCSEMDSSERQECGYYGIWRDECWERGCCWYTRDDWEGGPPWCYIPDRCSSNPCQNGGTCHNDEGAYICDCVSPYTGVNCESGPTTEPQPTTVTTTTTTEKPTSPAPESTVNIYTTEEHRTTLAKKDTTSEAKHSTFELTTELDVTTVGADATPSLPKVTSSGQTTVGAEFTTVKYSTEPPTTVGLDKITTANDLTTPLNGEEVTTSRAQSTKEMDTTIQESQTSLGDKVTTESYITTRAKATTESVVRSTDEADTTVGSAETTGGDIATTEVKVTTENVRPTTSQLRLTTEMETTVVYKETTEPHTTLAEDGITTEEHISTKSMETNPSTNRIVTTVEHKETTELGSNEDTTKPDWTTEHVQTTSSSVRQTTTVAPVTTEKMQPNLSTVHTSTRITTVVEVDTTVNDAESTQVPSTTHRIKASTAIPLTSAKHTSEAPEQTSLYPEKASTTQYQSTSLPSKTTSSIPEETSGSSSSILPSTTTTPSSGGGGGGFPGELPPPSFPIAAVVAVVIIFAGILPCTIGMVYIIGKMNDKKKKPLRSNRIFPDDLDM